MPAATPNSAVGQPWFGKAIGLGVITVAVVLTLVSFSLAGGCREHMKYHCDRQFRHIGVGCRMYAEKHEGRLPSKWSDLSEIEDGPPWHKMLRCPKSGHEAGIEAQVDLWADYRLIPGRTTNDPPYTILAIELLSNHKTGANVLFVDGSSVWLTREQVLGSAAYPAFMNQ